MSRDFEVRIHETPASSLPRVRKGDEDAVALLEAAMKGLGLSDRAAQVAARGRQAVAEAAAEKAAPAQARASRVPTDAEAIALLETSFRSWGGSAGVAAVAARGRAIARDDREELIRSRSFDG